MCDQKDCIHNAGKYVHHDHDTDKCEHLYPQIQRAGDRTLCHSKQRQKLGDRYHE